MLQIFKQIFIIQNIIKKFFKNYFSKMFQRPCPTKSKILIIYLFIY